MRARAFNSIAIDEKSGIFTKSSFNKEKIKDEVHYYLGLPEKIANFFPKLINYSDDYSAYALEYLPYNSLADLILKNEISNKMSREIINQLLNMLDEFHSIKPRNTFSGKEICNFYISKTVARVNDLKKDPLFDKLLTAPQLKINGRTYKNFSVLEKEFSALFMKFTTKNHEVRAIHGDFCFSNMLYFPSKKIIKLIDPRGSFTAPGIYGHMLYDYAKLMHCLHSRYDFIVNDQFRLYEFEKETFYYEVPSLPILSELEELYVEELLSRNMNVEFIYLIEASLFLSMASLHYENKQRQKVMYLTGLKLLNQIVEGKYACMY